MSQRGLGARDSVEGVPAPAPSPRPDRAPDAGLAPERRVVEPLEVDAVVVVSAGTALWAVALVVLVLLHGTLDRHGAGWWVWAAVAGIGLGLIGLSMAIPRRARLRAAARQKASDTS